MLKKRVIFTLLYANGSFMLSRNFTLQRVGDLDWLQRNYDFSHVAFSIDELIVLDVSRRDRDIPLFCDHLKSLTQGCFIPIAAGGGIRTLEHARVLLRSGADKVVLNTALFEEPALVNRLAAEFGQQCIVASIDTQRTSGTVSHIRSQNGSKDIEGSLNFWLQKLARYPLGELYLNSIDRDGTGQGYDMALLDQVPAAWSAPVILAGGAGKHDHLAEGLADPRVDAVATAHLFNFVGDGLVNARKHLVRSGLDLAKWQSLGTDSELACSTLPRADEAEKLCEK